MRKLALALLLAASGSDPEAAPDAGFACHIDDLDGNWRVSYVEGAAGSCGPLNDRITSMGHDEYLAGCRADTDGVSPDQCEWALEYTCFTANGSLEWVEVLNHVAEDMVEGVAILRTSIGGGCESAYDVRIERL